MSPAQARAQLDRALQKNGQDCILQRLAGSPQTTRSVTVRASVRDYAPHEIADGSGLQAGDSRIVISTTQIDAAQWPDIVTLNKANAGDPRVPVHGDRLIVQGRTRIVQAGWEAPRIQGELIRIEATIR